MVTLLHGALSVCVTLVNELGLHGDLWEDICAFRVVKAISVPIAREVDKENEVHS